VVATKAEAKRRRILPERGGEQQMRLRILRPPTKANFGQKLGGVDEKGRTTRQAKTARRGRQAMELSSKVFKTIAKSIMQTFRRP
jgi:hypothetical protein